MENNDNPVWRFFASVRLALFSLFILAATSIIGTLIPQGKPPGFYAEAFGPRTAQFIQVLDVHQMYGSWWFIALLLLFSNNLIVCTIDRLPGVWRTVVQNNLDTPLARLKKMPEAHFFSGSGECAALGETAAAILAGKGWKAKKEAKDDGLLLFAQKAAWSRLGVYAVHLSILIIFAGAMIGIVYGYKAFAMIPEGSSTDTVLQSGTERSIPLGFSLRCEEFSVSYYDNGMPREYRSVLTVNDRAAGKKFSRAIVVNDPLEHKGITFYQSSYEPMEDFRFSITRKEDGLNQDFELPFAKKTPWPGTPVEFGVINRQMRSQAGDVARMKVWFFDGQGEPSLFWLANKGSETINRPTGTYEIKGRQMFATGLQVAKDPGVWTVYAGCTLMLLGLYVAFFLSHRRIWVHIAPGGQPGLCRVLLCGLSNKNKFAFAREISSLAEAFADNPNFSQTEEKQA